MEPVYDQQHINGYYDVNAAAAFEAAPTEQYAAAAVSSEPAPLADEWAPLPGSRGAPTQHAPNLGMSYAHAHHLQSRAGQVATAPIRVQQLKAPKPAPVQQQSSAAAAPPKPKLISGTARVKSVLSGDTVVLVSGSGAEKVISLSGIQAPRALRGPKNADDDKSAEEPFGWESKEYLRSQLIGKIVSFNINHVVNERKEYGDVKLDDGKSVAELVVASGWARVKEGAPRKDGKVHPEKQALLDLQTAAEQAGLGVFSKDDPKKHTRVVDWAPDARKLFDKYKGQVLSGVVDRILDGSTLRVELQNKEKPLHNSVITLFLAGVQAPIIPAPPKAPARKPESKKKAKKGDDEEEEEVEQPVKAAPQKHAPLPPYALDAKNFVESLLLHRDVGVQLQGMDKANRLFGTLIFPKGNIAVELLKKGFAKLVDWTAALTPDPQTLRDTERNARAQRVGLFEKEAEVKQVNVNDNQYQAKVVQVLSGDSFLVIDPAGKERRLYLASITAPRFGMGGKEPEAYAFESKEFARQRLVGKKVKVVLEYRRPPPANTGNEQRDHVSVYYGKNNSNYAEELIAAGFAKVIQHRLEDPRSSHYESLLAAEKTAENKKVGAHNKKPYSAPKFTDLTIRAPRESKDAEKKDDKAQASAAAHSARAKLMFQTLHRDTDVRGIVEYVFSGSRLKVFVPKHEVVISFILSGIRCPAAPNVQSKGKDNKGEPYGKEAFEYTRSEVLQHEVKLEFEAQDKADNFIGTVVVLENPKGRQNLAVNLLEQGLASVFAVSADRSKYKGELYAKEEEAKTLKKNIWANWVPPAPKPEVPEEETKKETLENKELSEHEQYINVNVTDVVDASSFYVNVAGNPALQFVEEKMRTFDANTPVPANWEPERAGVCAGRFEYDGKWYRVRVQNEGDQYGALFIDYGNGELLEKSDLRPITDKALQSVTPLARSCVLAGVKAPSKTNDHYDEAREAFNTMALGNQLLAKVHYRDAEGRLHVTLHHPDNPLSVNQQLLRIGLARLLSRRVNPRLKKLVEEMKADEKAGIDAHLGVWEYGVVSDDEEDDPASDKGRPGARAKRS